MIYKKDIITVGGKNVEVVLYWEVEFQPTTVDIYYKTAKCKFEWSVPADTADHSGVGAVLSVALSVRAMLREGLAYTGLLGVPRIKELNVQNELMLPNSWVGDLQKFPDQVILHVDTRLDMDGSLEESEYRIVKNMYWGGYRADSFALALADENTSQMIDFREEAYRVPKQHVKGPGSFINDVSGAITDRDYVVRIDTSDFLDKLDNFSSDAIAELIFQRDKYPEGPKP